MSLGRKKNKIILNTYRHIDLRLKDLQLFLTF